MALFSNPFSRPLNLKLLSIRVPREEEGDADLVAEIARSEQLFSALLSIRDPFVIEVAVHNIGSSIHFYLAVPREKIQYAIQQINAIFPDAQVEEAPDYTPFGVSSQVAGGYLTLKEKAVLPLRTYAEAKADTFALILSTLSKLNEVGDGAAIQILVEPAKAGFSEGVRSTIKRLRKGEDIHAILRENILTDVAGGVGTVFETLSQKKSSEPKEPKPVDEAAVQALEAKIGKPLVSAEVRIVVATEDHDRAEDTLMDIAGSFAQFEGTLRNSLKIIKPGALGKLIYQYTFRTMNPAHAMTLNTEELASLFHMPTKTTTTPRINWLGTKSAEAPVALPEHGIVLGDSIFRGERRAVRLPEEDRRRHLYMVGQTGTGKSTLIKSLAMQDIKDGKGVCVIDPNGDLVDDVLASVPTERINDVIVFDPGQLNRPLGLNMLEFDPARPEQKTFIVNEMQSIFNRLFSQETMGPMFEQYMRNALLLLMEDMENEPATLVEVSRVFTDEYWRNEKLARIKNPVVIDFWRKEAAKAGGEASLENITPYITSKFGGFVANDYLRPIIGQPKSAFNFRNVMDEGKILLVKLPKGRIGDINANLLGMVITGKLLMAALGREDIPQDERRDFYLYIDEFQNFTTDSIATILSEARKYRLNLTIAHQFLGQLQENIKDAVFGNAGTIVAFRVGADDAKELEPQFAPNFSSTDLIAVENLNCLIRPLINGHPTPAFNMKIRFPDSGSAEVKQKLAELSALTYGTPLTEVEEGILKRLRS